MGVRRTTNWITRLGSFALFKFMLLVSTAVLCVYVVGVHQVSNKTVRVAKASDGNDIFRMMQSEGVPADSPETPAKPDRSQNVPRQKVEGKPHDEHTIIQHHPHIDTVEQNGSHIVQQHTEGHPGVVLHPITKSAAGQKASDADLKREVSNATSTTTEVPQSDTQLTNQTMIIRHKETQDPADLKTILLWNHFFLKEDFGLALGTQLFEDVRCPKTCTITINNDELPTADAVVVHGFHLKKDLANATIPPRTSQKQIFVFFLLENPERSKPGIENLPYDNLFNMTFTYLDDPQTDLFNPYGEIRLRWVPNDYAVPSMYALNRKNQTAVFLVSNCNAPSSRYDYVKQLSEHIDVDVIGKCGLDVCPKDVNCMKYMDRRYLFYLAFENGFCTDYATEKLFRTLRDSHMVPVVLGGANYTKMLPPNSFIDVRDYTSPKQLAEHLKYLSEHRFEYMQYFQWKRFRYVLPVTKLKNNNFCRLCMDLYKDDYVYKSEFKISEYWHPSACKTGIDERKAVHIM